MRHQFKAGFLNELKRDFHAAYKSYGQAYINMGGNKNSDAMAVWPTADVGFMDPHTGVNVVYDAVGPDVYAGSIDSLRPRGYYVNFGNASGPLAPIDAVELNVKGSLFFTKASMRFYQSTRQELENSAAALFDVIASGAVTPQIGQRYALADAAQAHIDVAERRTTGSTVLTL